MGFLTGKRVLIVGVASKLSIASGIAAAMHREGAELAFTYQNEKLKGRVEEFAAGWGSSADLCFPCDVASDEEIAAVFGVVQPFRAKCRFIVGVVGAKQGAVGQSASGEVVGIIRRRPGLPDRGAGRVDAERGLLVVIAAGKNFEITGAGAQDADADRRRLVDRDVERIVQHNIARSGERAGGLQRSTVGARKIGAAHQPE